MNVLAGLGIVALFAVPWVISRSKMPLGTRFNLDGMEFGFDGKKWVPLGNAIFDAKNKYQPGEVFKVNAATPSGVRIISVRWMGDHWVEL